MIFKIICIFVIFVYADSLQCYSTPENLSATDSAVAGTRVECSSDSKGCTKQNVYANNSQTPILVYRGCRAIGCSVSFKKQYIKNYFTFQRYTSNSHPDIELVN